MIQLWLCISLFNKQNICIESQPSLQPRIQMHISRRVQGQFSSLIDTFHYNYIYNHGPEVFLSSTVHGNSRCHMTLPPTQHLHSQKSPWVIDLFFFPFQHNLFSTQTYFLAIFLKKKITFIIRKSLQLLLLIYHETRPETKWVFGNLSNSNILARSFRSQVLHRILFSADMRVTVTLHALTLWSQ